MSVWRAVECQMRVNDVFCAVFERYDAVWPRLGFSKKTVSVIFLLPRPWAAYFNGEEFLCGTHHNARTIIGNTWELRQNDAAVHGFGVMSQWCASVCNVGKSAVLSYT